jgi:hypothetical protein
MSTNLQGIEKKEKMQYFYNELELQEVIGFHYDGRLNTINLNTDRSQLFPISEILIQYIKNKRQGFMLKCIEIFYYLVCEIEKIIDIRDKHGLKFFLFNFDKVYYDNERNKLVFNDFKITNNYNLKTLIFENEKGRAISRDSIQPLFYDEKISKLYSKMNLFTKDQYSIEKCKKFYSYVMYNFFLKLFQINYSNDFIENITPKVTKFRKEMQYMLKEFSVENTNFDNIKDVIQIISRENETYLELKLYLEKDAFSLSQNDHYIKFYRDLKKAKHIIFPPIIFNKVNKKECSFFLNESESNFYTARTATSIRSN